MGASSIAKKEMAASPAQPTQPAPAASSQAEQRFAASRDELPEFSTIGTRGIWPRRAELLQDEQSARETHAQSLMALADQKVRTVGAIRTPTSDADNESRLEEAVVQLARGRQEAPLLLERSTANASMRSYWSGLAPNVGRMRARRSIPPVRTTGRRWTWTRHDLCAHSRVCLILHRPEELRPRQSRST